MPVMIMAAGRGERMRPLTDSVPKPLLDVAGKPLIAYHLERLAAAGFTRVVVNLAYRGEQIAAWLGEGEQFGLKVRYSRESKGALETGGGIRHALPLLGPGPFMIVNGDVFTDYPFERLAQRVLAAEDLAHLVLVSNPPQHPGGDFALHEGRVRPDGDAKLTYSGIALLRAELVAKGEGERFPLAPLLIQAMRHERISGEHFEGQWDDIGTPERLESLSRRLRDSQTGQKAG